jgi:hypothetical protein
LLRSLRSLCLMARFARCDVHRIAAVFVESDEMALSESQLCSRLCFVGSSCRSAARTSRARIALWMPPTSSSLGDEKRVPSLLLSTAARDPSLIAPLAALAVSNGSLRSLRCSPDSRRLRPNPTKWLCRRVSSVLGCVSSAPLQIGGANIAGADRALDAAYFRPSLGDEKRVPSLLLSTAARDPSLIAPLAALAPRGSRFGCAYFVVARGRKACPLAPPQHGGARSE